MVYVIAVAVIWIVASFLVQSVEGAGISPFFITYICNSLFVIYLPIVEGGRYAQLWFSRNLRQRQEKNQENLKQKERHVEEEEEEEGDSISRPEQETLLLEPAAAAAAGVLEDGGIRHHHPGGIVRRKGDEEEVINGIQVREWSRMEIAKVGLLICPFWFAAQFTFNLSLKYTTVTSNTILSSASSLFTFLVSMAVLREKFTWLKLCSVLLCMLGTIVVSLADSEQDKGSVSHAVWGDMLCLLSALFYAIYTTLLRKCLPDEDSTQGKASTALFFGYLGLFNALLLAPVGFLYFSFVEPFHRPSLTQFGLVMCKGLFDNVLSDYLWAKAVLLTTPTAATAGLNIQVPLAAVVDSLRGKVPSGLDMLGAIAVLLGFFGINQPVTGCCSSAGDEDEEFEVVKDDTVALTGL